MKDLAEQNNFKTEVNKWWDSKHKNKIEHGFKIKYVAIIKF